MLHDIIMQAGIALEQDFAQMKLMELENGRLRKCAFEKTGWKGQNMPTSGCAHHMTGAENLDWLAHHDWESLMKDIFKEAVPWFKVLKKNIVDYQKALEKEKKAAECEANAAEAAEARALRAWGCGRGTRGGGRVWGRVVWGRATEVATGGDDDLSSSSNNDGGTGSSGSGSDSGSESEEEIPILQLCWQCPIWLIQACQEVVVPADNKNQPNDPDLPPPAVAAQPHPHLHMLHWPANTEDVERNGNTVTSENQAPEVERSLPSVAGQSFAHPCIIDHPAASR
jgi:hypothetical protein